MGPLVKIGKASSQDILTWSWPLWRVGILDMGYRVTPSIFEGRLEGPKGASFPSLKKKSFY